MTVVIIHNMYHTCSVVDDIMLSVSLDYALVVVPQWCCEDHMSYDMIPEALMPTE